jgi:hypothetical protein
MLVDNLPAIYRDDDNVAHVGFPIGFRVLKKKTNHKENLNNISVYDISSD